MQTFGTPTAAGIFNQKFYKAFKKTQPACTKQMYIITFFTSVFYLFGLNKIHNVFNLSRSSVCRCSVVHFLLLSQCVGLAAHFDFLLLVCGLQKIQICHQMFWLIIHCCLVLLYYLFGDIHIKSNDLRIIKEPSKILIHPKNINKTLLLFFKGG